MISVIDLGISNTGSVQRAFQQIGVVSRIINNADDIHAASALFMPGVGAYGPGMARIEQLGLRQAIIDAANSGKPLLAVCLGMQLLFDSSEEAPNQPGLSLLPGRAELLKPGPGEMVPNMGWCDVAQAADNRHLGCYYFVHSYAIPADLDTNLDAAGLLPFGDGSFYAHIRKDNIEACQFHPEKSQQDGLALLADFARRAGELPL